MFKMRGCIPPMVTPFLENGDVDVESLRTLVRFLNQKVNGIFICGSYGCGPMMSVEDRKLVAQVCREEAKDLQLIVMTGTTNTRDTIELTQHAKSIGADAASAVAPFYFHHNMDDVVGYYKDVKKAVGDFPFYIYTNPKFAGYAIDVATMRRLKEEAGLSGIKAASFDIMEYATFQRELADDSFEVVLGTEALWLPAAVYGAKAFIPGLANVFPEICMEMYEQSQRGEYEACRKTQFKINEIRDIMYLAKSTQLAIYAMLEIRGIISCFPKKPFTKASPAQMEEIRVRLQELEMI